MDIDLIRRSISRSIGRIGPNLQRASPTAILVSLSAAALIPVVGPLVGVATAGTGAAAGLLGLLGATGQGFVSEFAIDFVRRHKSRTGAEDRDAVLEAELAKELRSALESGEDQASALRADLSGLLHEVGGVQAALEGVSAELRGILAERLGELATTMDEFQWVLADIRAELGDIEQGVNDVREHLIELRDAYDLSQREMAAKLGLILLQQSQQAAGEDADLLLQPPSEEPPYKGLEAFQPSDAQYFFGRKRHVAALLARVSESSFVAVVAPSGSGKSSLLGAGLVPALWAGALPGSTTWGVGRMTPGRDPFAELARALVRALPGAELLPADLRGSGGLVTAVRRTLGDSGRSHVAIVIDQFEELFTLCPDEETRRAFIDAIVHIDDPGRLPVSVLVGVRADFYTRCAAYPVLATALQRNQFLLTPMRAPELREAIVAPAERVGMRLEPELVSELLTEVGGEPGALPLMSHALLETWRRRDATTLTLAGYQGAGGVRGAIARTADLVYNERLDETQREIARNIFIRLTELGEGTDDTRRRVRLDELRETASPAGAVEDVLQILAAERLVTLGQESVEVAHEALIREWPRLRRWLDEDRAGLLVHRELTDVAERWAQHSRDSDMLFGGGRLEAAATWANVHPGALNPEERRFLDASLRAAHRRRLFIRTVAGAFAIAALAAFAGLVLARRATDRANEQRILAGSTALAAQAVSEIDNRLDRAMLMSVASYRRSPTLTARKSVAAVLARSAPAKRFLQGHRSAVTELALSGDGRFAATGSSTGRIFVWDVASGRLIAELRRSREAIGGLAFGRSSRTLLAADRASGTVVWDLTRRAPARRIRGATDADASPTVALQGRGLMAFADGDDRLFVKSLRDGRAIRTRGTHDLVITLALSPDGRRLASGDTSGTIMLWDARSGRRLKTIEAHPARVLALAFSPDGRTLASGSEDSSIRLWDATSGASLAAPLRGNDLDVLDLDFSADGRRLASSGSDERIVLWDMKTRRTVGEPLRGHGSPIVAVALSADGRSLVSAGENGTVIVWDVTRGSAPGVQLQHGRDPFQGEVAFSPDGEALASVNQNTSIIDVVDTSTGRRTGRLTGAYLGSETAVSPRGDLLAQSTADGVELWRDWTRPGIHRPAGPPLVSPNPPAPSPLSRFLPGQKLQPPWPQGLAFSPDGRTLATGWDDGDLILWATDDARLVAHRRNAYDAGIDAVQYSPDGRLIATGSQERVSLWDARTFERRELGPVGFVWDLAFSPDGRELAVAASRSVSLWEVQTGKRLGTPILAHGVAVQSVAFSPDGRTLATAGGDRVMTLWDVASHERLDVPIRTNNPIGDGNVTWSPDGDAMAWAEERNAVLWRPVLGSSGIDAIREHFCRIVGRNLTRAEWNVPLPGDPPAPVCSD